MLAPLTLPPLEGGLLRKLCITGLCTLWLFYRPFSGTNVVALVLRISCMLQDHV